VAALGEADLVLANGLGLEEGLTDVLAAAKADGANLYEVAPDLDPIVFSGGGHANTDEGHDQESLDPHVWFDPLRVGRAAGLIAQHIAEIDPTVAWKERASALVAEMERADSDIAELVSAIPETKRKLVTNHEALSYFADRYGFEVIGVVIAGGSTQAAPSPSDLAGLVAVIEEHGVAAIFAETTQPTELSEAVAAETGGQVEVVELFTESLGPPGSGAETLAGMLLTDAALIAEGLG
jgi:zinc/manganese transport system substrate-binding protein